jgi:hypothetical protein
MLCFPIGCPRVFARSRLDLEPHPAPPRIADGSFADHLDPRRFEGRDQLDQRIDIAPHHRFAGLHALNGRHRKSRQLGEPTLIDAEKHSCSPQLSCCDH